nr:photosystem I subunit C [Helicanthes elasticus]WCQ87317.1 photosystem I subunit C [Helicanthes elasticus]
MIPWDGCKAKQIASALKKEKMPSSPTFRTCPFCSGSEVNAVC